MGEDIYHKIEKAVFYVVLVSVFLLPHIYIPGFPYFRLEDILFLPVLILAARNVRQFQWPYPAILCFYGLFIVFTIFLNWQLNEYRDFFEVYKLIKFGIYTFFFALVSDRFNFMRLFRWIFLALAVFNLFHYYNWFNFNQYVEYYYSTQLHLESFGVNSLGQPATKRLLGTMGNPNNNAILFLFFMSVFSLFRTRESIRLRLFYYAAFFIMLVCQSRTALVAFAVLFALEILFYKKPFKSFLIDAAVFVAAYFGFQLDDAEYIQNATKSSVAKSKSVTGRMQIWELLWKMIKERPFFGHGPHKSFFYSNNYYPESQYLLMTWRYGFIGLFVHFVMMLYPVAALIYQKVKEPQVPLILFTAVIAVTSLMNTPLNEPRILLMFAFVIGAFGREILLDKQGK